MTELYEPFSGVDGAFKSSVEKLLRIRGLLPRKKINPWDMMLNDHINN